MRRKGFMGSRVVVLLLLLSACSPSEAQIATAIAQTELARPTATATPEPTASPTRTATPTPRPAFSLPTSTSTWDRYKPGTIGQVTSNTGDELASLADKAFYYNFGDDHASRVVATYTGQFRPVSELRTLLIGGWFEAVVDRISRADGIRLFATEALFLEDSVEYWLPVQTPLVPLMKDELTEGRPATLLLIWIGATFFDNELDRVFLVNEFLATPGAITTQAPAETPTALPTVPEPAQEPGVFPVEVDAAEDWQDTGVTLQAYDKFEVEHISGTWSINPPWGYVGPAGHSFAPHPPNPVPDAQPGELIGRIGPSVFRMGRQGLFLSLYEGRLYLRMNDDNLADNDGVLLLQITVQ